MMLISEATRLKRIADQKLSTVNPGTKLLTNTTKMALMIIVNNPKVRILIGSVKRIKIGLSKTLKTPKTKATHKAVTKLLT